ncbi:MAG: hypothetical protein M5U28_54650 [Sandaracinaceae bacterium]|nr:hypothetical protein [Sandaracinaceae bacterium]
MAPSGHGDGLASVIFLSRAGALHDARVPPAVTHALSRLLLRATRVGDEEVDEHLEREGFAPSIAAGDDGLLVQAVLATDALPRYLEALSAALRGPALRPDDLARVREDDGELLDGRLATPYGVLGRPAGEHALRAGRSARLHPRGVARRSSRAHPRGRGRAAPRAPRSRAVRGGDHGRRARRRRAAARRAGLRRARGCPRPARSARRAAPITGRAASASPAT